MMSSGLYRPLALWKRPALYASLAAILALAAGGASFGGRRSERHGKTAGKIALALLWPVGALLAAALFVWHTSAVL
jgi:hypothetical protein